MDTYREVGNAKGDYHQVCKGELVQLKYTFRYEGKFVESDDDWLKCIEATSDELLGPYSKAEDNALSAAFGSRKRRG
jgi:hypothetical protein